MVHRKAFSLVTTLLLVAGLILRTKEARAQGFEFKGEAFGKIGAGCTGEDEGGLGQGLVFGGGAGFMLSNRWEFVIEVQDQENDLDRGPGKFFHEGRALTVGANFQYHFSTSRLQPYLRLGFGYAHFDGAKGFKADHVNPGTRIEGKQNFWGPDLGFGLKVFINEHVSIRPEARFYAGGSGEYVPARDPVEPGLFLTSITIGIGYHW